MRILNLTQHVATKEQIEAGVYEPASKRDIQTLLTFDSIPTSGYIRTRAIALARMARAENATVAMIGGAPYLMSALEKALMDYNIQPVYSFSVRKSVEVTLPSGEVKKESVFVHEGFIEA